MKELVKATLAMVESLVNLNVKRIESKLYVYVALVYFGSYLNVKRIESLRLN